VLLIVVDTLRADHLGAYGYACPTSPHIDELARSGAVFERAHATAAWTLPSMASLLTGLMPSRHGCGVERGADGKVLRRQFLGLAPGVRTLAEAMAARGHATAAVVTNNFLKPAFGLQRGFGHYVVRPSVDAKEAVDELLRWFEKRPDGPFFVLAHFMDPHMPYAAAGSARGEFTRGLTSSFDLPVDELRQLRRTAATLPAADRAFVTAAYDEEIASVDAEIGRLLAALRAGGTLDDTFVVLTADHGEELFEHKGFEHGHSLHEEVLHVPLIVTGPGIEARRIAIPVSLLDVPATICALAEAEPGGIEGTALVHALRGESEAPRSLLAEGTLYGEQQSAILAWPRKLIVRPSGALAFDLEQDPGELARRPVDARFSDLRTELERRQEEERRRATPAPPVELDPEAQDQLEDLGYGGDD
jgi:arylsulfatase A-like enzyme